MSEDEKDRALEWAAERVEIVEVGNTRTKLTLQITIDKSSSTSREPADELYWYLRQSKALLYRDANPAICGAVEYMWKTGGRRRAVARMFGVSESSMRDYENRVKSNGGNE